MGVIRFATTVESLLAGAGTRAERNGCAAATHRGSLIHYQ
jgi:hypothetical protein